MDNSKLNLTIQPQILPLISSLWDRCYSIPGKDSLVVTRAFTVSLEFFPHQALIFLRLQ